MGSESKGGVDLLQVDEAYEFCAPRFFDFMNEENEDEIKRAELWFEISQSYAPSPFMPKIREGRSVQIESFCDFGNDEQTQKESENGPTAAESTREAQDVAVGAEATQKQELRDGKMSFEFAPSQVKPCDSSMPLQEEKSTSVDISSSSVLVDTSSKETSSFAFPILPSSNVDAVPIKESGGFKKELAPEACTPKAQMVHLKGLAAPNSSKNQTAKKMASVTKQRSGLKQKDQTSCPQPSRSTKPKSVIKCPGTTNARNNAVAVDIAQENQAIKRQKLDDGRSRQILNVRTRVLLHKSKPGLASDSDLFASALRGFRENSTHKQQAPFISTAEMVNKFQSRTREIELSQNKSTSHESTASMIQRRPKLRLTRPKEPEFETAQRVRAVRVKSSAELEEEMLAKIPKFKARPVNKKILEAPTLPSLPKSTPKPPEFQEFHLKTMERAIQQAETSSVVSSVEASSQNHNKPCKLTEPRPPILETSLRARPPQVKSSQELELEELEKIPKFKAKPLNKKILESKGDLGLFCIPKPQITVPQEFHFKTNERLGPPAAVTELFDKLSIQSDSSSRHDRQEIPRITIPNPFHLYTEDRGVEKERQLSIQKLQKQLEEERARIPKATPYPYTTDYPVVPPKPEPKPCTKPEAFQLESLIRHEEEMQRKMEEKERMEREEAERRRFKAHPILREDPIPLPERERKPLTDVQEFVFHVDQRAVERTDFDKKVKEKEMMYKRVREEYESAKMIEEEKAVKQMRREMVPHARPLPKFNNPFLPQKSVKDPTKAKSPKLRVKEREERRKHAFLR